LISGWSEYLAHHDGSRPVGFIQKQDIRVGHRLAIAALLFAAIRCRPFCFFSLKVGNMKTISSDDCRSPRSDNASQGFEYRQQEISFSSGTWLIPSSTILCGGKPVISVSFRNIFPDEGVKTPEWSWEVDLPAIASKETISLC
jgi:hypothetical protein